MLVFKCMSEGIPLWITNSANLINSSVFTLACSSSGQSRQLPWWLSVSPWLCWKAVTHLLWTICTGEGSQCLVNGSLPMTMISASDLSAPLKKEYFLLLFSSVFLPKASEEQENEWGFWRERSGRKGKLLLLECGEKMSFREERRPGNGRKLSILFFCRKIWKPWDGSIITLK